MGASPGLIASLRQLLASATAFARTRLALVAADLDEARVRLAALALSAAAALVSFALAALLALVFVIAAFWDTPYRLIAIGVLAALFALAGGLLWRRASRGLPAPQELFAATRAEFAKDRLEFAARPAVEPSRPPEV